MKLLIHLSILGSTLLLLQTGAGVGAAPLTVRADDCDYWNPWRTDIPPECYKQLSGRDLLDSDPYASVDTLRILDSSAQDETQHLLLGQRAVEPEEIFPVVQFHFPRDVADPQVGEEADGIKADGIKADAISTKLLFQALEKILGAPVNDPVQEDTVTQTDTHPTARSLSSGLERYYDNMLPNWREMTGHEQ